MIKIGDTLPKATLQRVGASGPELFDFAEAIKGRKIALFGLPGAYTGTCSTLHLPSFIRTAEAFRAKGVDDIVCLSVNDVHVMTAWGESSGAFKAGIKMWSDAASELTRAMGLEFDYLPAGLVARCKRFSAYVVDGKVVQFNPEASPGVCETSAGETLLAQI